MCEVREMFQHSLLVEQIFDVFSAQIAMNQVLGCFLDARIVSQSLSPVNFLVSCQSDDYLHALVISVEYVFLRRSKSDKNVASDRRAGLLALSIQIDDDLCLGGPDLAMRVFISHFDFLFL